MKKALLIGPAPCLIEDLEKINIEDYDLFCSLNRCYHKTMKDILDKKNIKIDNYYFSDLMYKIEKNNVESFDSQKKILIAPRKSMIPVVSQGIYICEHSIVETIDFLGEYSQNQWATTGMFALGHLIFIEKIDFVKICGFSFGEGDLHIYDNTKLDLKHHSPKKERKIYEHFHKQGKCSI